MRSLRSRWLGELLLPVLVAIVEVSTIAPLLALVAGVASARGAGQVPWSAALAALGLLAFWSTRLLSGLAVGPARGLSLLLWVGATFLWLAAQYEAGHGVLDALRKVAMDLTAPLTDGVPLLVAVGLALLAWRRGLDYGSDPAPFSAEHLRALVRVAFVLLAATVAVAAVLGGPGGARALASAWLAVPLATICGLLTVAATQLEEARRQATRHRGRAPGRGSWLLFAGGAALLIVVMALLIGGLLGRDIWGLLSPPVITGLRWLSEGLLYLLLAFAFLIFMLFYPFVWLAQRVFGGSTASNNQPPQMTQPPDFSQFAQEAQRSLPSGLVLLLRGTLVAVVVAVGLLILLSALRRYRTFRRDEDADEQRESLWSRDLALAQLRSAFSRRRPASPSEVVPEFTGTPKSVREAYRALGLLARHLDLGRQEAESASVFSDRLRRAWPVVAPAIDDLTVRYLRVRYGETPDEADRMQASADWEAIWRACADQEDATHQGVPHRIGRPPYP